MIDLIKEDSRPIMVSIRCCTYNHEPYIRQCLEGFVMQKTNFRFEAIVHDDASTDATATIIREYAERYPDIIKPIFETENQYSKHDGSLRRIMNAHMNGKYIAWCEGDDYWIDPLKLQKQVDFLEEHQDYGLCYTKIQYFYNSSQILGSEWGGDGETFDELIIENTIPTLSVMIRFSLLQQYTFEYQCQQWKMGDYPLWLFIASEKKIKFLPFTSGVYRILENSASHNVDVIQQLAFTKSSIEIAIFWGEKKKVSRKVLNIRKLMYLHIIAQISILKNDSREFADTRKKIWNSSWSNIPILLNVKSVLLLLLPMRLLHLYLNKKNNFSSK